jgi:tetratricopeptide (TPR) repeat protein
MSVFTSLSVVALRQLVSTAGNAVGLGTITDAIIDSLTKRFTDNSQRLTKALETANNRAWQALEIALAGDSLLERCKVALAATEDREIGKQLRAFLDVSPYKKPEDSQLFREALKELRTAKARGVLTQGQLAFDELGRQTAGFARFADPQVQIDEEWKLVDQAAGQLRENYPNLHAVLIYETPAVPQEAAPTSGSWLSRLFTAKSAIQKPTIRRPSLLAIAVRYYFRREVETDPQLFQGLAITKLEALQEGQAQGFAALTDALTQQGRRLEGMLEDLLRTIEGIKVTTTETNVIVRGMSSDLRAVDEKVGRLVAQVEQLIARSQLEKPEVRPSDSFSIRNDAERQLVKILVRQYDDLPEEERGNPSLLIKLGKVLFGVGDFKEAQRFFKAAAQMSKDPTAQAEAHINAYQAALEQQAWADALVSLRQAVGLNPQSSGEDFGHLPLANS